ncbi:MAG: rhodanese-like domain-containing protein [Candidatus Aminicenantes bacterium]|jgi:rhodanese-related sulfurtransferase
MKLVGKQIGVLVALVLAIVILFLPGQDSRKYRFDPQFIARSIEASDDHIDPTTISQWIIEGRRDFMLIDIRGPEAFEQGHIKGAENIPLSQLLQKDTLDELPQDKLMVIYSNGSSHAAQAWLVMKTAGFDSYMLAGGFNYWNRVIMNPKVPAGEVSDDEILRYKTQLAVKGYFGGESTAVSSQVATPDKPKTKKIIRRPRKKKKKLKGC